MMKKSRETGEEGSRDSKTLRLTGGVGDDEADDDFRVREVEFSGGDSPASGDDAVDIVISEKRQQKNYRAISFFSAESFSGTNCRINAEKNRKRQLLPLTLKMTSRLLSFRLWKSRTLLR